MRVLLIHDYQVRLADHGLCRLALKFELRSKCTAQRASWLYYLISSLITTTNPLLQLLRRHFPVFRPLMLLKNVWIALCFN